jgi:membrane dipeptidase
VTKAQEKRVQEILRNNIVVSLHDHGDIIPKDVSKLGEVHREGRAFTAFEALSRSGLDCIFDNLMDGTATITSKQGWKWEDVIYDLGMRLCDIAHQKFIIRCEDVSDIQRAFNEGLLAFVPVLESAMPIENEIDRLDVLFGLGVLSIGVTYSESNSLGSGLKEPRDGGLTSLGRAAVERMNKLGLLIDTGHCGDQTTIDTAELSKYPIVISHAGARALWNTTRMKPDEVIKAVAKKGGLIGIEASPHTSLTKKHIRHSIESVMEHFEYCVNLVGIDHVTFGPDTLYGDHVGLHKVYAKQLSTTSIHAPEATYPEMPFVSGMENPTENFPNIVRWLVAHNYTDEDIIKAIGGNSMRVMSEVWPG